MIHEETFEETVRTWVRQFYEQRRPRRSTDGLKVPEEDALGLESAPTVLPPLDDAEARAMLTRIMNLAALRRTPRAVHLLREAIDDAQEISTLRDWSFLRDLRASLSEPLPRP